MSEAMVESDSASAPVKSTIIDRWVGFVVAAYLPILIAGGVLAYYSLEVAKGLKLKANVTSLMPDGVPSVENLQKVIQKTGGYSSAMIVVDSPDPDAALRYLEDLRRKVAEIDWVTSAQYAEDTAVFERNRLIYVEQEDLRQIGRRFGDRLDFEKKNLSFNVDETPVSISIRGAETARPTLEFDDIQQKYTGGKAGSDKTRIFRNEAGNLTILVVFPEGGTTDATYAKKIANELGALIDESDPASYHPELTVELGGRVYNLVAKLDSIMNDIKSTGLWSISGIFLVLVVFYRRFMAIFYIGLPLVVGFLMTFALTKLTLGSLNILTVFLILILFGLGIDFGIHNLARYDEVRKGGGSMRDALRTIYSRTGYASFLAAVTTIMGFYSLMLTNFKAFSEFGFIAGSGVALTLLSMYLFFPALMVFAEKIRLYRVRRSKRRNTTTKDKRAFPAAVPILVMGFALFALAVGLAPEIQFEDDFGKLGTHVPQVSRVNDKIKQVFPLRSDKAVVFVEELEDVEPLLEELERIRLSRSGDDRTIEKVRSIYDVVPKEQDQRERLEAIENIQDRLLEAKRLLEDFSDPDDPRKKDIEDALAHFGVSTLAPRDLPTAVQRMYTGIPGSGGYLVYIYNSKGMSKFENAEAFVEDIRTIEVNGKEFYPATEAMIFVDMLNLMKQDAARAVVVVLVAVFIVMLISFRSIKDTLIVLVPVVVGMGWMLGLMVLLGTKLNIFNMVVLPTVLGIGIDNGIHIYHRFREEGGRVLHVIRTTGGAAFLTTLTTMLGFAGTLTASNQGLQSLGLVACIGLGCCMVSSLTVFPALLQFVDQKRKARTVGLAGPATQTG